MMDNDPISYPISKQLRKAGISRIMVESQYLIVYANSKDQRSAFYERPLFMVNLSGSWKQDRGAIHRAAERVLPYHTAQLLLYQLSISDYFLNMQSVEAAAESVRTQAGYEVARTILLSSSSSSSNKGIKKKILSRVIEALIDVSSNEADRVIFRLIKAGKLIEIPKKDNENDSILVLGLWG